MPHAARMPCSRAVRPRSACAAIAAGLALACAAVPCIGAAAVDAAHDAALAGALGQLALSSLDGPDRARAAPPSNAVTSPLSLAIALGMLRDGTTGAGAHEIATTLGSASSGARLFQTALPGLAARLAPAAGHDGALVMADRIWVDRHLAHALPQRDVAALSTDWRADAALVDFTHPEPALAAVNDWAAARTAGRIASLMPAGSIGAATRMVVTDAIHFSSPWARPFDVSRTRPMAFRRADGTTVDVPTMSDERPVRRGRVGDVDVVELPFQDDAFALLVATPAAGRTLAQVEAGLDGIDLAGWSAGLEASTCRLELPRFSIAAAGVSLKPMLQALGVATVFGPRADFGPMLGKASTGVHVDDVFQSATIVIDEHGGEAAAATGATLVAKSLVLPSPGCRIDRPFLFAVIHKPSGAPLFVGHVADPSRT